MRGWGRLERSGACVNMVLRGQTHTFERRGAKVALCLQCNGRPGRGRQAGWRVAGGVQLSGWLYYRGRWTGGCECEEGGEEVSS